MERVYNKLVRDNIPNIICNNGENPITKILEDGDYKKALEEKLIEECHEVINAKGKERLEELADVLEVLKSLAESEESSLEHVIELANNKRKSRGGFNEKIFLEKVITK